MMRSSKEVFSALEEGRGVYVRTTLRLSRQTGEEVCVICHLPTIWLSDGSSMAGEWFGDDGSKPEGQRRAKEAIQYQGR